MGRAVARGNGTGIDQASVLSGHGLQPQNLKPLLSQSHPNHIFYLKYILKRFTIHGRLPYTADASGIATSMEDYAPMSKLIVVARHDDSAPQMYYTARISIIASILGHGHSPVPP